MCVIRWDKKGIFVENLWYIIKFILKLFNIIIFKLIYKKLLAVK